MNFQVEPEHLEFGKQLRRAFADKAPLTDVRASLEIGETSAVAWKVVEESGIFEACLPEIMGGAGFGAMPLCVAAEEIGWAVAAVPALSSIYLPLGALAGMAANDLPLGWERMAREGVIAASISRDTTDLPRLADGKLTGTSVPIAAVGNSPLAFLQATKDDMQVLVAVELEHPHVSITSLDTIDPGRSYRKATFDAAPAKQVAQAEEVNRIIDRMAILLAFEQIGCARRALSTAVSYAQDRETFGRKIGSYQAIKHMLADVWAEIEIANAHCLYGAWALENDSEDLGLAASAARASASRACLDAAKQCLQVHGGIGFTFESDCHLFYRRARGLAAVAGSHVAWTRRLARSLTAGERPLH